MLRLKASHLTTLAAATALTVGQALNAVDPQPFRPAQTPPQAVGGHKTAPTSPSTSNAAVAPAPTAAADEKKDSDDLTPEEMAKLSAAIGNSLGRSLKDLGVQLNQEDLIRGLRSGLTGGAAPMSDQDFKKMLTKVQEKAYQRLSTENLKAANEFIVKNKNAQGVVEIEPGKLQYLQLQDGSGTVVAKDNAPQIKYVGKYIDGTVFGNSEDMGGSITVPLNQTIQGFSRGLVGMKEGEKRRLFVHPDLGYGTMGQLPPNALLIFDVEVVKANNPDYKPASLSQMLQEAQKGGALSGDDEDDDDLDDDFDDFDYEEEDEDTTPVKSASNPSTSLSSPSPYKK